MGARDDDTYVDDAYDAEYDDTYEGPTEDGTDSYFPTTGFPYGWPPNLFGESTREEYDEGGYDPDAYREEEGSWLDEGIIGTLLLVGAVLFVIPEPATTTLGILLVVFGVIAWVADALT